jgi:lipoate-protein ligase A
MTLNLLPTRTAGAAENMAIDFLLLQRYPNETAPRFRHYEWRAPAFTFGYSQKIDFVRSALPAGETFDLCRRPTGGGLVDHRDDWTFSLVIPRGHPLEDVRATQSYREIHECLARALRLQSIPASIKQVEDDRSPTNESNSSLKSRAAKSSARVNPATICFEQAELYDVVYETSGQKIAGAAQKRNKHGLLFQGSLWRPALKQPLDDEALFETFTSFLAETLGVAAEPFPWPEFNEDEVSGLTEQYASTEWLEAR